jgi:hypothetical protein
MEMLPPYRMVACDFGQVAVHYECGKVSDGCVTQNPPEFCDIGLRTRFRRNTSQLFLKIYRLVASQDSIVKAAFPLGLSLRFVSHFSVYNRFDAREIGSQSSNATESRIRSGVVRHASLHDPANIF